MNSAVIATDARRKCGWPDDGDVYGHYYEQLRDAEAYHDCPLGRPCGSLLPDFLNGICCEAHWDDLRESLLACFPCVAARLAPASFLRPGAWLLAAASLRHVRYPSCSSVRHRPNSFRGYNGARRGRCYEELAYPRRSIDRRWCHGTRRGGVSQRLAQR